MSDIRHATIESYNESSQIYQIKFDNSPDLISVNNIGANLGKTAIGRSISVHISDNHITGITLINHQEHNLHVVERQMGPIVPHQKHPISTLMNHMGHLENLHELSEYEMVVKASNGSLYSCAWLGFLEMGYRLSEEYFDFEGVEKDIWERNNYFRECDREAIFWVSKICSLVSTLKNVQQGLNWNLIEEAYSQREISKSVTTVLEFACANYQRDFKLLHASNARERLDVLANVLNISFKLITVKERGLVSDMILCDTVAKSPLLHILELDDGCFLMYHPAMGNFDFIQDYPFHTATACHMRDLGELACGLLTHITTSNNLLVELTGELLVNGERVNELYAQNCHSLYSEYKELKREKKYLLAVKPLLKTLQSFEVPTLPPCLSCQKRASDLTLCEICSLCNQCLLYSILEKMCLSCSRKIPTDESRAYMAKHFECRVCGHRKMGFDFEVNRSCQCVTCKSCMETGSCGLCGIVG